MVSTSVVITFIFGVIVVGKPWNIVMCAFSTIAFFIDLGEEIAADALDMEGDKKINSQSIALKYCKNTALKISSISFALVVLVSIIPFILGWLGIAFLIMILLMDSIIVFLLLNY